MNKAEFIDAVKVAGDYNTKKDAEVAVNAFIKAVEDTLKSNESIELVGFGKFENVLQKGKEGKIPGSDKSYKTEDKFVPKFKPGKVLKDCIAKLKIKK